jgi:hypothetical protein
MPAYVTLAEIPSSSGHGSYEIKTEGTRLSCNCPGWTRQVHYPDCGAVRHGAPCNCRGRINVHERDRIERTCKHLRQVQPYVDAAGGVQHAITICATGRSILDWRAVFSGRQSSATGPVPRSYGGAMRQVAERLPTPRIEQPRISERHQPLRRAIRIREED